jgi:hypothetical protein
MSSLWAAKIAELVAFDPDNKKYTYGAGILTIAEIVAARRLL